MYAYGKLERLEPAVVMDAAAATHEPQLLVKVISTGEHRCVPRSHIEAYSPAPAFKPGQTVYRAMWSGEEEKAKVRRLTLGSCGWARCLGLRAAPRERARERVRRQVRHALARSHAGAATTCARVLMACPEPLLRWCAWTAPRT